MVGLGESCIHLAAILVWTEIKVKFISSQTVTDRESYWLAPKDVEKIVPQPAYKIDLTTVKSKNKDS